MIYKLKMNIGKTLKLIASTYPTLMSVVLELVQNSLDSNAKKIMVVIDYNRLDVKVHDDGEGISCEKFFEAIGSVCDSIKEKGKLGEFGIGLLSPLGKCKIFTVTSIPKGSSVGYNKWFFDSEKILRTSDFPEIPHSELPKAVFSRSGGPMKDREVYNWRTEVHLKEFKNDKTMMSVSFTELERSILSRFSVAMKKLNSEITICIKTADGKKEQTSFKAAEFKGEKMKPIVYGESGDQTYFEMYISPKTANGRKGEVTIGVKDDTFRIGMKDFVKSISSYAKPETLNLLTSGTFEGVIISDNCTLHQNRKEFIDDDNLMNLVIHLEEWVTNHGQAKLATMKDAQRDEWLQAVGSVAINNLENRIKKELPHLLGVIKNFKMGFAKVRPREEGQGFKSKTPASPIEYRKGQGQTASPSTGSSDADVLKLTVAGPHGQRRRLVSSGVTGLQFVYEELPGNDNHWEFDGTSGVLIFNMRSDIWEMVERSGDRSMILYQEYVGIKALEMQLEPEISRLVVFKFLQRELKSAAFYLVNATSAIHPRKANSKIGKKI